MTLMDDFKQQVASAVVKIAPPAGISAWVTLGNHLDDWIKIATLIYIIVQLTALVVGKYLIWTGKIHVRERDDESGI